MASLRRIIGCSLVILIIIVAGLIIIILASAFAGRSASVLSVITSPVASLGKSQLLSCYLPKGQTVALSRMSVTWTKSGVSGVVYELKNGAANLQNQNSQFSGRAELFPTKVQTGNASLFLTPVRIEDQGEYTCSISIRSSSRGGTVSLNLHTEAFSAPTFNLSGDSLEAVAEQWFPKPSVTWTDQRGTVLPGNTSFTLNNVGVYRVETLISPVNISETYALRIDSGLKTAISDVSLTGSGVTEETLFHDTSAASTRVLCSRLQTFMVIIFLNALSTSS